MLEKKIIQKKNISICNKHFVVNSLFLVVKLIYVEEKKIKREKATCD